MFNHAIHILFNSSILVPFIVSIGLSKIFIENNYKIGIIIIVITIILSAIQLFILRICKKQLVPKLVNILNVSQDKESWILAVYISYFAPFVESYLGKKFNLGNWILILLGVILVILSRKTVNNPMWHFLGYKVYSVSTEQGIDFTLLSKRKLRNSRSVKQVIRIFEYFIMEV